MAHTSGGGRDSTPHYNILSLDGGGTWALLQSMVLADLYGADTPGHEILKNFRLVAANSGGSLTAAGLWANMSPAQLIHEFESTRVREEVFSRLSLIEGFPSSLLRNFGLGPKYDTEKKLGALRQVLERYRPGLADQPIQRLGLNFGDGEGGSADLLILAYDYDTNRAKYLRTSPRSRAGAQIDKLTYRTSLVEAVHASTTAPVNFFDAPAEISYTEGKIRTWDGAIAGYNNPILAGVTEALANGADRHRIRILSLGTGSTVLPMQGGPFTAAHDWLVARPYNRRWGVLADLVKLSASIIENPPDVATYVGYFMIDDQLDWMGTEIGDPIRRETRIVRLNPLLQPIVRPGTTIFDVPGWHSNHPDRLSPDEFRYLLDLDLDAVKESDVRLIRRFGQLWIDEWVHNQPILAGPTRVESELGQRWYSQGRDRVRELCLAPPPSPEKRTEEEAKLAAKMELEEGMKANAAPAPRLQPSA